VHGRAGENVLEEEEEEEEEKKKKTKKRKLFYPCPSSIILSFSGV
jgi:hypothetical protein